MGGYGFLRFSVPMLPEATAFFTPLVHGLSVVAVIYALPRGAGPGGHEEADRLFVGRPYGFRDHRHFTVTRQGIEGAMFQMLSHGIVSAALFLVVGVVHDRLHTRMIDRYDGLVARMPVYALIFMVFMLAAVGLPGTGGFVGQFLVIVGAFQVNTWVALLAATGWSWARPTCSVSIAGSSSGS